MSGSSTFVTTQDGLRLHVHCFGQRGAAGLPVVCLPGLARTGADFDALAHALADDPAHPRWVIALDSRGRGRSDYDRDAKNYNPAVELADVLAALTALGIERACFIGTSRGGILVMLLAAARPDVIAGAVLNDIGPVIEAAGLIRIKSYVGKLQQPKDFDDGGEILRRLFGPQFPRLTAEDWRRAAQRMWEEREGQLRPRYDVKLADALADVDPEHPAPTLWAQFDALAGIPLMVIRGANSDILSRETVAAMRERRPDASFIEVPDEGHPALLADAGTIGRIADFVAACGARSADPSAR